MSRNLDTFLDAVRSVRTLAMRRAVVEAWVFEGGPMLGAPLLEGLAWRAACGASRCWPAESFGSAGGEGRAREGFEALASAVVHRRASGDTRALEELAQTARALGLHLAADLCGAELAAPRFPPRGRLAEVPIPEDALLSQAAYGPGLALHRGPDGQEAWRPTRALVDGQALVAKGWFLVGGQARRLHHALQHPRASFVRRLLELRFLRSRDVLRIAARRPSSHELLLEVARSDRWFADPRVRVALALNPFAPAWLVLVLLPTLPSRELRRLLARADASPPVLRVAAALLGERDLEAPVPAVTPP